MVNIDPKQPKGASPRKPMSFVRREPRGTKIGGRFADLVSSETTVELGGDEVAGYQPDGSAAFEERMRRSQENATEAVTEIVEPASSPRSEDEPVVLSGAVEYAESWQYPPVPKDIGSLVSYWSDVALPDSCLANIENADKTGRDFFEADEELKKWDREQPAPTTRYRKKHPVEYAAYVEEYNRRRAKVDAIKFNAGLIPRSELRDVARIGHLWFQSIDAGETMRDQAWVTKFRLGTGEVVTTKDIVQRYRLNDIYDAFFNRRRYQRLD